MQQKAIFTPSVEALLASLTLEEKLKLLGGHPASENPRPGDLYGVERVGLAPLRFADGPVGVHWWTKASTCYPALICLAASFDIETAYRFGQAIGTDCRAHGVHVLLAPGVNLYRSPLCGRNFEYLGEDPELSGALAAAYVRGVQDQGVAATVKHFAANNQEFDRHSVSSDLDERTLHEVYLRPFERAVKEGRAACIMTGYNLVNQVHASENAWLVKEVLRRQWGFEGIVMSDWTSVYSTAQSLEAGLDLEMPWARFLTGERIRPLLDTGVLTEDVINDRIRNRLQVMERFGWLDPAHQQQDEHGLSRNPESEAVALDVARHGQVLLKNEQNFLPKPPSTVSRIVVLGQHAVEEVLCGGGSAFCPPHEAITLEQAFRTVYGDHVQIEAFRALDLWRAEQAWKFGRFQSPEGEPGLKGEYFNNNECAGEPAVIRMDERPDFAWIEARPDPALDAAFFSVRWTGTFEVEVDADYDIYISASDGYISVAIDGVPLSLPGTHSTSVRRTETLKAGMHDLHIEYRQVRQGWATCHVGYEPVSAAYPDYEIALQAAREGDLVVVATGFVRATEGEGSDRSFGLDPRADQLILDAAAANPNTAVLLYAGGAVDVSAWIDRVRALLCLWYPGQNGTLAAAEILAGRTNPSGRLPFTWERNLEDRGSFTCYHTVADEQRVAYSDGVFTGYRWFDRHQLRPRYPFGYGLSYTAFKYENLRLSNDSLRPGDSVAVQVEVTNTGDRPGATTVLLFAAPPPGPVLRPEREFKAARRIHLEPGQCATLHFELPHDAFAFWDTRTHRRRVPPGPYTLQVGPDAASLTPGIQLFLKDG
jgi:beta-glucosidase